MIRRIIRFITEEIWMIDLTNYPKVISFLIHQLRIILLAGQGFRKNRISLHASALTFYSLLSVVPVAALAFGISKGFGFEERFEKIIRGAFEDREDLSAIADYIIGFANNMLKEINGGFIAGIGLIVLFWAVMQVLGNIEDSFNAIWEIKKPRPFVRKFSDYLSMMLIAPILFILSSTITVYITNYVSESTGIFEYIGPVVAALVKMLPYILIFLLFTILYVVMPNTKVIFKYGLYAGIISGTIFQVTQWIYIQFQVGVSKYGAIYGSFLFLPLFLAWLQLSWLIVLLGAELSFAYQNIEKYEFESASLKIPLNKKRLMTLLILHHIIRGFIREEPPMNGSQISQNLGIPMRLVRDILFDLNESGLVAEMATENPKETALLPSVDVNQMTISFVQNKLDTHGDDMLIAGENEDLRSLMKIHTELLKVMEKSPANKLIKDI